MPVLPRSRAAQRKSRPTLDGAIRNRFVDVDQNDFEANKAPMLITGAVVLAEPPMTIPHVTETLPWARTFLLT